MIHSNSEQLAISLAKIINQPLDFDIHCQLKRGTDMVDPVTGELLYSVGNVGRLEIFVDNVPFIDIRIIMAHLSNHCSQNMLFVI